MQEVEALRLIMTEDEREDVRYLKAEIDFTIGACITSSKEELIRAYDLRNGHRSEEKFEYIWKAYGIEFPGQMRHVPVLRSMFDVLVGQEWSTPIGFFVSGRGKDTLMAIQEERKNAILRDIRVMLAGEIERALQQLQDARIDPQAAVQQGNPYAERTQTEINKLEKKYRKGFKSLLEIGATDMLHFLIHRLGLKLNFNTMFEDLITAGQEYYQVKVLRVGEKPLFRVLNPLNLFYQKGTDTKFIKDCMRAVYVEELTPEEVINQFGHLMETAHLKEFTETYRGYLGGGHWISSGKELEILQAGEASKRRKESMHMPLVKVYHTEWKANNTIEYEEDELAYDSKYARKVIKRSRKRKFRLDRYEGIRIGDRYHVAMGKSKHIFRPDDDPSYCGLTFNGVCYNDRNGEPYSLVLKTEDISDKIDVLHYHWENLVAMSGTKAVAVNFADIPAWMGPDPITRAMKWLGYVKQGMALVDYTQEGQGVGKFNNQGDYDLTLSNSISVIIEMLRFLEDAASKITGVSRQRMGQLTQNDLKSTAEMAENNSSLVTHALYSLHNEVIRAALSDLLEASRICYSEGITGSYVLGKAEQKIFRLEAGQLGLMNMDIHLTDDQDERRMLDQYKGITSEMIANGLVDPIEVIDVFSAKSMADLKNRLEETQADKQQNNTSQLQQQLEEYQKELQKLQQNIDGFKQAELQMKQQEMARKIALDEEDIKIRREESNRTAAQKDRELDLKEELLKLEAAEIQIGKGNRGETKNI